QSGIAFHRLHLHAKITIPFLSRCHRPSIYIACSLPLFHRDPHRAQGEGAAAGRARPGGGSSVRSNVVQVQQACRRGRPRWRQRIFQVLFPLSISLESVLYARCPAPSPLALAPVASPSPQSKNVAHQEELRQEEQWIAPAKVRPLNLDLQVCRVYDPGRTWDPAAGMCRRAAAAHRLYPAAGRRVCHHGGARQAAYIRRRAGAFSSNGGAWPW
ncbi:unnamed protein product, partial [Urochloa humidicola]